MAIIDNFKMIDRQLRYIKGGYKGWAPADEEDNVTYCEVCEGTGKVGSEKCISCNGTGAPF